MKFPQINKQPTRTIGIPKLSGGMNLRDSVSLVNDNQLTKAKNVWFKDGVLKTRPNIETNSGLFKAIPRINSDDLVAGTKVFPNIKRNGKCLVASQRISFDFENKEYIITFYFWWQGAKQIDESSAGFATKGTAKGVYHSFFAAEKDNIIYVYLANGEVYKWNCSEAQGFIKVDKSEMHIPLVMADCLTDGKAVPQNGSKSEIDGVFFEGYNLLGERYKITYNKVNQKILSATDDTKRHNAVYSLPYSLESCEGMSLSVKILNTEGKLINHDVTISTDEVSTEAAAKEDGITVKVNKKGYIELYSGETLMSFCYNDFVTRNDIEITAPYKTTENEINKVCKMTQSEWFGGASAGINGGSRLFLTGNTDEKDKALIIWSALDNPLYFPENNYAYVGNKAHSTTGFGKQSDKLVIFKENETYYTYYNQNADIAGADMVSSQVVDYQASSVYFPLVLINGNIGCDCPNTIQLCRNRLVWLSSIGKVYTLVSESQYTERNIFEVSEMSERLLKAQEPYSLKMALSADFEGHYVLFVGHKAFLMDYNCYGFQYVHSYSKTEDANILIPWYYFEFEPLKNSDVYYFGNTREIICLQFQNNYAAQNVGFVSGYISAENCSDKDSLLCSDYLNENLFIKDTKIHSEIITKIFNFGSSAHRKDIPLINIAFGNNDGVPIEVSFMSDKGKNLDGVTVELMESGADIYSAEYVHNRQFRPNARGIDRIGIKIESKGIIAVDSISINYRVMGGNR